MARSSRQLELDRTTWLVRSLAMKTLELMPPLNSMKMSNLVCFMKNRFHTCTDSIFRSRHSFSFCVEAISLSLRVLTRAYLQCLVGLE